MSPRLPTAALALLVAGTALAARPSWSVAGSGSSRRATATYVDYERNALTLSVALDGSAGRDAMSEFGTVQAELDGIQAACDATSCGQAELDRRLEAYYRDHALIPARSGGSVTLTVDVPMVVRRNVPRVRPVAVELQRVTTERSYSADQTLGAAVALVQTALVYERPPLQEGDRRIAGFYPPPRVLEVGSGDCDSKSALLASVLRSFPGVRLVGVHVPGHYIVGIDRVPRSGDAFVEYRGVPYVLVEPAGPGMLPPGTIAETTRAALATMLAVKIEPLF